MHGFWCVCSGGVNESATGFACGFVRLCCTCVGVSTINASREFKILLSFLDLVQNFNLTSSHSILTEEDSGLRSEIACTFFL